MKSYKTSENRVIDSEGNPVGPPIPTASQGGIMYDYGSALRAREAKIRQRKYEEQKKNKTCK